jgi:hypothetical protein
MMFLAAEASIMVGGESLVRRELLRINDGDRRFELRPHGTPGSVCLDLAPGLMHATLSGHDRATLEVEWIVTDGSAIALDAWAMCGRQSSQVSILDAFGQLVIPDLTARDPAMHPMVFTPGRFLLRAETFNGPLVLRVGQSTSCVPMRAAV